VTAPPARHRGPAALGVLAVLGVLAACSPAGPRGARPSGGAGVGIGIGDDVGPLGPTVAVGLEVGARAVTIDGDGPLQLSAGGRADEQVRPPCMAGLSAGRVELRCGGDARRTADVGGLRLRARPGSALRVAERSYDGEIVLVAGEGGVTVINSIALETYLLGVVPHEIGARPAGEIEAVKAQAIAARTYAVAHRGRRRSLGFDYWGDTNDQVYRGLQGQDSVSARAIRETSGQVLTYDGRPIEAYYHSTCGGRTAAIDEVWRRGPVPYLRSISDLRDDGGAWCESSSRYRWNERWDWNELGAILERTVGLAGGDALRGLRVRSRTPSGRVAELEIQAEGGDRVVFGDSVRWALRRGNGAILNSARIDEIREGVDAGGRRWMEVSGGGWGHGIGMCQVGAMARARFGQDYRRILGAYYPGTELQRLY
jgi:stage II sporulation protein D